MADKTPRDEAWLVVLDHLERHQPIQTDDIVDETGISAGTARAVLGVAVDEGKLWKESPRARTWWPAIGPLGRVEDVMTRLFVADAIAEEAE